VRRELLIFPFLILATLVVFWQVGSHDFINLDDSLYVTLNAQVQQGLSTNSIVWAFTSTDTAMWIPLSWLSFMLDFELYALQPGGYHLTNLFFHLANTLLLFLIFNRVTGKPWRSAFVAALFALHPLRVESVAWVTERKDVLSTFFGMLSMLAYVSYAECPGVGRYLPALLAFALALMTKPMVVTLPVFLLLLDYWPLVRFRYRGDGGESEFKSGIWKKSRSEMVSGSRFFWEKVPFFFLAGFFSVVTLLVAQNVGAVKTLDKYPLGIRLANALISYVHYIWKMIWPLNLAPLYPHPGETLSMGKAAGAGLFLAGITVCALWAARQQYRYVLAGWLWYLVGLVPVIGLVQAGQQAMADRFTYLPLIGLFWIVSWGVPDLVVNWRYKRTLLSFSAGLVLALLMACTWFQVKHWRNSITLFEHTLRVTENNGPIHNNLGIALLEQGRFAEAVPHFTEALQINPNDVKGHINLAVSLVNLGDLQKAVEHYTKALELEPHHAGAHNNLGNVLLIQGRVDEAAAEFSKALEINGDYAEAHNNLGVVFARQGRFTEAIEHFNQALRINPDYPQARRNLDRTLRRAEKGKTAGTN